MTPTSTQLDHLIHLVPSLEDSIALYSSLGFIVLRGGQHADGLTENALIVLPDGIYIELIAFVQDDKSEVDFAQRQSQHWWYGRRNGWIDWCLLGVPGQSGTGLYKDPVQGGRKLVNSDEEIRWRVTFPTDGTPRGKIPFWCADITPREKRVPQLSSSHPNGCEGVCAVRLLFKAESMRDIVEKYAKALGGSADPENCAPDTESYCFYIGTPEQNARVPIIVKRAQDPEEIKWVEEFGEGVNEIELGGEQPCHVRCVLYEY